MSLSLWKFLKISMQTQNTLKLYDFETKAEYAQQENRIGI